MTGWPLRLALTGERAGLRLSNWKGWGSMWREYLYPTTVEQAIEMLTAYQGQARVIAGGTDLTLELKRGQRQATCLVDISRIPTLRGIQEHDGSIVIGATTTHAEIARSALLRERAAVLAEAAAGLGCPQVRQVGTIGGNVVNAQPAADAALALLALDAEAELVSRCGSRWVPLEELYAGPGVTRVDPSAELVRAFRFRAVDGRAGSAYRRLNRRKTVALPALCAAAVVRLHGDSFASAAIAVGPVATRPWRASAAEHWLIGTPANDISIGRAAQLALKAAEPRDSILRGSRAYRKAMVEVLVTDVLQRALTAAKSVA